MLEAKSIGEPSTILGSSRMEDLFALHLVLPLKNLPMGTRGHQKLVWPDGCELIEVWASLYLLVRTLFLLRKNL